MIPSLVAGLNCAQLRRCSSDRKKVIVLHAWGRSSRHLEKGTETCPIIPSGSIFSTTPSRIATRIGSPQSKHGASIWTVFPGKSQQTASDSNAHWPNHFCWPSMVIRNWVGRLLKGAKDVIKSVFGNSQPGIPAENKS